MEWELLVRVVMAVLDGKHESLNLYFSITGLYRMCILESITNFHMFHYSQKVTSNPRQLSAAKGKNTNFCLPSLPLFHPFNDSFRCKSDTNNSTFALMVDVVNSFIFCRCRWTDNLALRTYNKMDNIHTM